MSLKLLSFCTKSSYDTSCYLPLAGFLTFDDAVEQYLFSYVLLASNVAAKHGATYVLKRLLPRLRQAFPRARLRIRLKELKLGLEIDRTSCRRFLANQFRALMSVAAYVLMQELRPKARRTGCGRAQVNTLRLRLLKLGAWIESSVRRIVIHLPIGTPFADEWRRIARSVGAVVT